MNFQQQTTLQMVIDQGQVSVTDLAKATGVPEVTIRQNLNTLEKLNHLRHAHGPAVSLSSDDIETRMMSNYMLKHELAEFTASLVQPSKTIFIENGNSSALLARTLSEQKKDVAIIVIGSYTVHLLKDVPCEIILFGDVCQKKSESMVGLLIRQCIQQVYFSKTFIGIDSRQPETGFTGRDMMRTDMIDTVLEKECETIILIDSSKFGVVHSHSTGPVERLNHAITDSKIRASNLIHLEQSKLAVHVVDI